MAYIVLQALMLPASRAVVTSTHPRHNLILHVQIRAQEMRQNGQPITNRRPSGCIISTSLAFVDRCVCHRRHQVIHVFCFSSSPSFSCARRRSCASMRSRDRAVQSMMAASAVAFGAIRCGRAPSRFVSAR